jgi:hypothetical protein
MSKTENERTFFIDHINKKTTWVRDEKQTDRQKEFFSIYWIDWSKNW